MPDFGKTICSDETFSTKKITHALQNAGLVIRIDHWVMEIDPSQVISENPENPEIPCYSLSTLSYKHQYPCPDASEKKSVHRFSPETTGIIVLVLDTS